MTPAAGGGAVPDAALAGLAELGPFFAVRSHVPGRPPDGAWRSMGGLLTDPGVLRERVAAVRAALASGGGQPPEAVESRVAASVAHLGLTARLVSPYLALAVLYGRVPAGPRLADVRWQPVLGGPYPLSLPGVPGRPVAGAVEPDAPADVRAGEPYAAAGIHAREPDAPADVPEALREGRERCQDGCGPRALAEALAREILGGPVRELVGAFAALRVSPHILWGNAASAVSGAAGMIAVARPERAARTREVASLLLELPGLRGTATRTAAGDFRRRSCCLIYRAAPEHSGALCGDCALRRA